MYGAIRARRDVRRFRPDAVAAEVLDEQAPHGYEIFQKKQDGCIKVVLKP